MYNKNRILGKYKFDKAKLNEFLYVYFYGNKPILSPELQQKIYSFNTQQQSETEKIIAGRDY